MGDEPRVSLTDLEFVSVPTPTYGKPFGFHFFRVSVSLYSQKPIRRSRCLDIDVNPV
jgi:hypothetical protein